MKRDDVLAPSHGPVVPEVAAKPRHLLNFLFIGSLGVVRVEFFVQRNPFSPKPVAKSLVTLYK